MTGFAGGLDLRVCGKEGAPRRMKLLFINLRKAR